MMDFRISDTFMDSEKFACTTIELDYALSCTQIFGTLHIDLGLMIKSMHQRDFSI